MMKSIFIAFVGMLFCIEKGSAQSNRINQYFDVTFAAARYQGTMALSFVNNWSVGERQRLTLGLGLRLTGYLGANQYYTTAPAILTSGSTSPLIIFQNNITANIDTFLIKSPQANLFNLSINLGYRINTKLEAGFNIDAIGFSFGGRRTGNYINGPVGKMLSASPTMFNTLLISDNDRGSLNSEFFVRYKLNNRWGVKLGASFLFTEYTTAIAVQQFPQANDRFRNKSLLACLGISYKLQSHKQ
jgi:hypothetical protein